jgi:hypothetical protein
MTATDGALNYCGSRDPQNNTPMYIFHVLQQWETQISSLEEAHMNNNYVTFSFKK